MKSNDLSKFEKVKGLFDTMNKQWIGDDVCKPDIVTLNTVISAYSGSSDPNHKAEAMNLLRTMNETYDVAPDTWTYNICISAMAKSGHTKSGSMSLQLLNEMEEKFLGGDVNLAPDAHSYCTIIDSIVRAQIKPEAKQELTEKILTRMELLYKEHGGLPPTDAVYNAALNTLAMTRSPDAAVKAKDLLERIVESKISPTIFTYNTVLKVYLQASSSAGPCYVKEATDLLLQLENNDQPGLRPDSHTYSTVISIISKSQHLNKAGQAFDVLTRMVDSHKAGNKSARPNVIVFNAVLNACGFSNTKKANYMKVLQIALRSFSMLQEYDEPDHATFGTLFRVLSRFLPRGDRREDIVRKLFIKCRLDGHVSELVIKQLRYAASGELYTRLTGHEPESMDIEKIPLEWQRKVKSSMSGRGIKKKKMAWK